MEVFGLAGAGGTHCSNETEATGSNDGLAAAGDHELATFHEWEENGEDFGGRFVNIFDEDPAAFLDCGGEDAGAPFEGTWGVSSGVGSNEEFGVGLVTKMDGDEGVEGVEGVGDLVYEEGLTSAGGASNKDWWGRAKLEGESMNVGDCSWGRDNF